MTDKDTCMTCKHCQPMAGAWMCGNEECKVYGKEVEADCFCDGWERAINKPVTLDAGIEVLDMTCRTYRVLKRAGIDTVRELASLTWEQLAKMWNMGRRSMYEIVDTLRKFNIPNRLEGDDGR